MAEHHLKCWPEPFKALLEGTKTHEFRRDDRCPDCGGDGFFKGPRLGDEPCPRCKGWGHGFAVGDVLVLKEFVPAWPVGMPSMQGREETMPGPFTGREVRRRVTYLSRGPEWGIPPTYVVMSLAAVDPIGKIVAINEDGTIDVRYGKDPGTGGGS